MTVWFSLIEDSPREGALNMAVDQHLLDLIESNLVQVPILRVYTWSRPTLSLGFHQQWRRNVDPQALAHHGVDLVRRLTGGRAVLHDDELTYAIAAPMRPPFHKRIKENYRLIGEALQQFTAIEGARPANLAGENPQSPAIERGVQRQAPCFASLAPSELERGGKKLIGSAQKLGKAGFLQHGSVPIRHRTGLLQAVTGTNLEMDLYMTALDDHYRAAGKATPDRGQLAERLAAAFVERFGIALRDLRECGWPDEREVELTAEKRYRRDDWTYRK